MAKGKPLNEKIADSLRQLIGVTNEGQRRVFRSDELSRLHRERLIEAKYIQEIMKGWYYASRLGFDAAAWHSAFWEFAREYLNDRFGTGNWVISPEGSVAIHAERWEVPPQVVVHAKANANGNLPLPYGTSIYVLGKVFDVQPQEINGTPVYPAIAAICEIQPNAWRTVKKDILSVLGSIRGTADILRYLVGAGASASAGRLAGALRKLDKARDADQILQGMKAAGFDVRETDPFGGDVPEFRLPKRPVAAIDTRIRLLWSVLRDGVLDGFTLPIGRLPSKATYLTEIEDRYISDAYNSLSIEGYQVTPDLIERVSAGDWDPDHRQADFETRNALAARGYWQAFQLVKADVGRILDGENAAEIVYERHADWRAELFRPLVNAGFIKPVDLIGYRQHPVYIRGSAHVPVSETSVQPAMDAMLDCLANETDPRVGAVLGPFVFTYIHPFGDGNGRTGRFIMNAMLASGGYPWTIIPVARKPEYMAALEEASSHENARPLASFIADLVAAPPPPRPDDTGWPKFRTA
ncbi:Fic family protein [Pleomorphomonas diazotrophica]|uniref:Fic family protein n=1 Tax=Pleomorphomonas diazotrophica TaxID=1166257 RepID=A0A1I4V6I9_9HYPH|nr:Fic family protein [Pleomorphomonas diazotrophica]PKR87404.1 Fic family protein [Pleomorphomonas diazotrophica]SFM96771.1 Fic/DOC family protein [Pleomorphomonas diazotrophica]